MRNVKTLIFFAIVTITMLLAAVLYRPIPAIHHQANVGPLLPGLAEQLNKVQTIAILHAGENVTLQRQKGTWVVVEKANYPAMEAPVRELLFGLINAQRIEPKTRNHQYYSNLGLADPDKSGSEASRIDLKDHSGHSIAKVTIGKRKPKLGNSHFSDFYALTQADPQSWLAEGDMPAIGAAGAWLKRTLLELDRLRIIEVTLSHSDGEIIHIVPKEPNKPGMTLEGLKSDETLQNDYALDDVADRFTRMQLEDVQPLSQIKWPEKSDLQIEAKTKDGLIVRIDTTKIDNQPWIRLVATVVPKSKELSVTTPANKPSTATVASKEQSTTAVKDAAAPKDTAPEAMPLQQEANELNARWQGWAYTLADWAYQALNKRRADLVKLPAKPAAAATATTLPTVSTTSSTAPASSPTVAPNPAPAPAPEVTPKSTAPNNASGIKPSAALAPEPTPPVSEATDETLGDTVDSLLDEDVSADLKATTEAGTTTTTVPSSQEAESQPKPPAVTPVAKP